MHRGLDVSGKSRAYRHHRKNFLSPRRKTGRGLFNQTVGRFGAVVSLECGAPSSIAFEALGDIGMAKAALFRSSRCVALAGLVSLCFCGAALSKNTDDGEDEPAKEAATPNLYLDLRTYYTTVPAGSLSLGFGNSALFATLPTLATLSALTTLPSLPTLTSPASRSIGVDVPLAVDFNDRVSVYGGFSASASRTDLSDWSALTVNSWMVGFQADVYQQNGGSIPTITVQSTLTRSVPEAPLPATALTTILEFDYALDADETRGLLAGVQYTRVAVDSVIVTDQSGCRRICRRPPSVGQQLEIIGPLRRSVIRRRATSQPDAVPAFHPAARTARPGPDGRQRQPPVWRDRADRVGAEAVLPADRAYAALRDQELGDQKSFDTSGKSSAYLHHREKS